MKHTILYIFLAVAVASLASCNKWLDIMPEDTTTEKALFSTAGGYHSAINGLYQQMASSALYGENLSWGFVSALSQYYNNTSANNSKAFSYTEQYEYGSDEVKAYGEEIWQTGYNVIINANNILKHLETADPSIFPEYDNHEVDIIKGEALAVRALVHFDILRLFAVAPAVSPDALAIPYVETYPSLFNKRLTVSEVIAKVEKDLSEAASLLVANDTDKKKTGLSSTDSRYYASNSSRDYFFTARGVRMNYVAVRSIHARVKAYAGDMKGAYDIASDIVTRFVEESHYYMYTTSFSSGDIESNRPHKLLDELLVSFYSENLSTDYTKMTINELRSNPYALKNIDGVTGIFADSDDYRKVKLVKNIDLTTSISIKYLERSGSANMISVENRVIPVMRLSELYLIMAEYLASDGSVSDAVKILNDLRIARGCMSNRIEENVNIDDFNKALGLEIWRENVAEGQYFFYCKRTNAPTINNNGVYVPMVGKYTMLIPDSEISLN